MIIGVAIWVVALAVWGVVGLLSRRRRRRDPPTTTPQQAWDDSDPQHRTWTHPPGGPGFGS